MTHHLPPDPLPRWWLDQAAAIGRAVAHGAEISEAQQAIAALAVAMPYPPPPFGPHTLETIEDHWRAVRQDRRAFARHIAGQAYKAERARLDIIAADLHRRAWSMASAGASDTQIKAEAEKIAAGSVTTLFLAEVVIGAVQAARRKTKRERTA